MFRSILKYSYFILCVSALFAIEQKVFSIQLETPTEWIIPVFNVLLLVYAWKNRTYLPIKKLFVLSIAGLGLSILLSIPNSEVLEHSIKGTLVWISYLIAFGGGFWVLNFNQKEKQQFLIICGVGYGVLLLYSFIHYLIIGIRYHNSYKMALPFANGHTLLIAMAFPLWIYLTNTWIQNPQKKWHLILLWGFYTFVIYLSYSRFYWVMTTLITVIVFLNYYRKWIKITLVAGVIFSVTAYIAYIKIKEYRDKHQVWLDPKDHASVFVQIESIFVLSKNESTSERSNRWKVAKMMFFQSMWTGIGINTFPERYYQYLEKIPQNNIKNTTRYKDYMNAHNLYIGTMAEQGILGLFALLFFIGVWFYYWRKLHFVAKLIFVHYLLFGIIEDFTLLVDIIPCFWVCVTWGIRNLQETQ